MQRSTALIAMLASILLPAASSSAIETHSMSTHAPIIPVALSPATDVQMILDTVRFDGRWAVVLFCPASDAGAVAYAYRFTAEVTGGVLHGQRGSPDTGGWMTLDGAIQPDGTASLDATGLNEPDGALARPVMLTKYAYHAMGRFRGAHGIAARIEGRICNLHFTRQ